MRCPRPLTSPARRDLTGGPPARAVPTGNMSKWDLSDGLDSTCEADKSRRSVYFSPPKDLFDVWSGDSAPRRLNATVPANVQVRSPTFGHRETNVGCRWPVMTRMAMNTCLAEAVGAV